MAPLHRGCRRAAAVDPRLRGPALGRRCTALLRRASRGLDRRGTAAGSLHRAAGALREPSRLGRRQAQLEHDLTVTARGRRDRTTPRRAPPQSGPPSGNPLYAEEFVRMLTDQGLITEGGELVADDVRVPDTVQALIAARLDTLT